MDAEENVTQPLYFGAKRSPHPRSLNHYLYFSSASHKAGAIATKGYFQVKEFLSREIPILPKRNQAENSESTAVQTPEELLRTNRDLKKENLKQLVQRANEVLAEASTVFPFTLFPDTLILDRTKLTIIRRTFFMTNKVMSIHIEDILNISVSVGPLFGSLNIGIKGLTSEDHFKINYFWRKDAIYLKHVIQGYIIAQHDKVDYRQLHRKELVATLEELGHDSGS